MARLKVVLATALTAALLSAGVPTSAQEIPVDPLTSDSLLALARLVEGPNCTIVDAADGSTGAGNNELPFRFCDDGLPPVGGGAAGIPVPVKYHARSGDGEDWKGLPRPAVGDEVVEADARDDLRPESDNRITLDVDVSVPTTSAPGGGRPVIVLMHGCCGGNKTSWEANDVDAAGEKWHHSNAFWASRGYVVVTYTARGFRDPADRGSSGTTQLDSRRYEVNDLQYLVGLLADHDASLAAAGGTPFFDIDPQAIGVVGGSYGGGLAWMTLTDPKWSSPISGTPIRLGAVVPKYGWTDLLESLVPGGHYQDRKFNSGQTVIANSRPGKARSLYPLGVEKQSIVAGLYASGNAAATDHTTFPTWLDSVFTRLQAGEPYDGDPLLQDTARSFIRDRSAYYQPDYWKRVRNGLKIPIFAAATWTDPLFPTIESVRFYNKLKQLKSKYPIQMYLGDYQHFVQNKATEWGDLCGAVHRLCRTSDFRRDGVLDLDRAPARKRMGINTRIDRFLDHYLRDRGKKPPLNVAATTTTCPANATAEVPLEEPGIEYRAATWRELTPARMVYRFNGGGNVNSAQVDSRGPEADPVARSQADDKCFTTSDIGPPKGVVQYVSEKVTFPFTMMGIPAVSLDYSTAARDYWVEARMFDLAPEGSMTMVARASCRVNVDVAPGRGCATFDLSGNGWRFEKNHQLVFELSSADSPFLRKSNVPSVLDVSSAAFKVPVIPEVQRRDFRD